MKYLCRTAIIAGLGLLGGSLALAMRRWHLAETIIGLDLDRKNLQLAADLGAIDQSWEQIPAADSFCDLLILAAPIQANLQLLQDLKAWIGPKTVVTDVGSTKEQFVRAAEALLGPGHRFVGGHPMAGSEIGGMAGADPYLFENAVYLLTPTASTCAKSLAFMETFAAGLGAKAIRLGPAEHDAMTAAVSHVPQIAASALANTAAQFESDYPQLLALAAGGFRDMTRIAAGNPGLWRDICFSNRDHILQVLKVYQSCLQSYQTDLETGSSAQFSQRLQEAKELRAQVPKKLKGYWLWLDEIIVTIPDEPGMIGSVAGILGAAGINIDDIEILHIREGEGGTLRLGFAREGAAARAAAVLEEHGYPCRQKLT